MAPKEQKTAKGTKKEKGQTNKREQQERKGKRKREERSDEESPIMKKPQTIQYKCNLKAFCSLVNKERQYITLETREELKKTPFWKVIQLFVEDKLTFDHITKKDTELTIMLQLYNKQLKAFQFGQRIEKITVDDVSRILGLPKDGKKFVFNKNEKRRDCNVLRQNFGHCGDSITKKVADSSLVIEVEKANPKKTTYNDKDAAVLILISFFTSFLFPNTASTLTWDLANACSDLESLNKYNWAAAVLEFLEAGLNKVEANKLVSIQGCLLVILVKCKFMFIVV